MADRKGFWHVGLWNSPKDGEPMGMQVYLGCLCGERGMVNAHARALAELLGLDYGRVIAEGTAEGGWARRKRAKDATSASPT